MDFLHMTDVELIGIWQDLNSFQIIFHPDYAPNGKLDQSWIAPWAHTRESCSLIVDNNIYIDLIKLCRNGQLSSVEMTRRIALLMLWVELHGFTMTAGMALQEKYFSLDNDALSDEYSIYESLWKQYTPQQWFDLYKGRITELPRLSSNAKAEHDMSAYSERFPSYYHAYASMLHLVVLLRNTELSGFDRVVDFLNWTYDNTIVSKYVTAYAILLFMEREEGIKSPKKANSNNITAILNGCKNQAWDLSSVGSWSQMLSMHEDGIIPESFLFATQDELLKKVIMCCVERNDLNQLFSRTFNAREQKELDSLFREKQHRVAPPDAFDVDHLLDLAHREENSLIKMTTP